MNKAENQSDVTPVSKTIFNIIPPQTPIQSSHGGGKTLSTIVAGTLRCLDSKLLASVATYFSLDLYRATAKSTTDLTSGILNAAAKLNTSEYMDAALTRDTICYFNSARKILCTSLSLDTSTYSVALPDFMINAAKHTIYYIMPQAEKVKLLSQAAFFLDPGSHGSAELMREDLTFLQMQSVLSYYEINHSLNDSSRELKHRHFSHKSFLKTNGQNNKIAIFCFTTPDPLNCTSISSVPKDEYNQSTIMLLNQ
jgi:hypothetical protein